MHRLRMRVLFIAGWFICIAMLAGWLVDAIHRGHLASVLIVATGLAALIVVPLLKARLDQPPPP